MTTVIRTAIELSRRHFRVLSIAQARKIGLSRWTMQRLVDVGHWQRLANGIYLTHSAAPSWNSRAQAALFMGGSNAFLSDESAWFLNGFQDKPPQIITLSVPLDSRVRSRNGLRVIRRTHAPQTIGRLTRTTPEHTLLDLMDQKKSERDIIGLITHAFRNSVHEAKVLELLNERKRYRNRKLVEMLLHTVVHGTESPLEYLYDKNVEIPHGLPRSEKQRVRRVNGKRIRVDRRVELFRLLIELDGYLGHPGGPTDRDMWRDNANLIKYNETTLRYRWANIVATPCETAGQIAAALAINGWRGEPTPCSTSCRAVRYQL